MEWYELLCFGSPTVQLAHQHVLFCTVWPDRAKGLLRIDLESLFGKWLASLYGILRNFYHCLK